MKKAKNLFLAIASILSAVCSALLLNGFDGLLSFVSKWTHFDYQSGAFILAIVCFISCICTCLLLPAAQVRLQYEVSIGKAFAFSVKRYCFTYMVLPFFVMRFACIDKMLPYLQENQIHNPLYHQTIWKECAEWGSMLMVLALIFWVCLLALNLFGVLRYGHIAVNLASLLCLLPLMYLTLDYAPVTHIQNITLTVLVLLVFIGAILAALLIPKQATPPLRPFFAQAENDDLFWRKKRETERKWRSYK